MLAECQMSAENNHHVKSYIESFMSGYRDNVLSIARICNISAEELAGTTLSYASGMRRAGGMSIWRLIDDDDRQLTCASILLIVKAKME